jgi:monofunctional biosynthetic peptidoglycan transglycosylase
VKILILSILFFGVMACGTGPGCAPRFADLKTKYPHVLYHGPNQPSEVVIRPHAPAHWTSISRVPKVIQGAFLVSEDWAFYQHSGYDEKQIQEALRQSIQKGKLTRGASTITQQVVRNLYLSKEKSLIRKGRELWMATKIEKVLGKQKILELYLNIAEMGEGIFGVGEAADFYFHKAPEGLRAKEAAFLAMLLPSPKRYSISFKKHELTPYARRIIHSILNKMVMARYLTPEQRDQEWRTPLWFESKIDSSVPDESLEDPTDLDEEGKEDSEDLQSS